MHVFLCGPIHVGKSTVVQNVLRQLILKKTICAGGFVTYPGIAPDRDIYISSVWEPKKYYPANKVAQRGPASSYPFPQVFDTLGVSIILRSKTYSDLLCMDELGFFEQEAICFQNAVLQCLEESIPVFGVVKEKPVPWLDAIKNHPAVEIISVSEENRNTVTPSIVKVLEASLDKRYSNR
ncbi:MAG TPA: nucleoside-triphosphatase [Bacillota bacterium]|jgi:nucleoside-triphosphatase THEP1|nr:nucleoside-triphosphatase [Bacillota bacterium]